MRISASGETSKETETAQAVVSCMEIGQQRPPLPPHRPGSAFSLTVVFQTE